MNGIINLADYAKGFVMAITPLMAPESPQKIGDPYQVIEGKTIKLEIVNNNRAQALAIREKWMRIMGMSEEEIAEACCDDRSPIKLDDEIDNLRCAAALKEITPPISVLASWAVKR